MGKSYGNNYDNIKWERKMKKFNGYNVPDNNRCSQDDYCETSIKCNGNCYDCLFNNANPKSLPAFNEWLKIKGDTK